ncbi:MAG: RNA polymerase sigma factor [bacterium]
MFMVKEITKSKISKLIEDAYPKLERFAISICKTREEAKDVVGETMLIAYERYNTLNDEKAFLSFLFTIASRVKVTLYRKTYRYKSTEPDFFEFLQSPAQSPETLMDFKILYSALGELSYKMKEAVILYDISGLSYKEVAKVQETSIAAVKLRIYRGRKLLAKILGVENDLEKASQKVETGVIE